MARLEDQISAYERLLPALRAEHGAKWAVFVDCIFCNAFDVYEQASRFARQTYPDGGYLIRHTNEEPVTVPFLTVQG